MNSNKQCDLYAEFEPEANEILFGQTTMPDRPLTDKEKSKRKKILLKLLDQKLKFELIELMNRQQNHTSVSASHYASPIPTTSQMNISDSNILQNSNPILPSSYQSLQYAGPPRHHSLDHVQGNWQTQFQKPWQPSIYHQQYEMNPSMQPIIPWSNQNYGFRQNVQPWWSHRNQNEKPLINRNLIEPNTNWVCSSQVSSRNIQSKQSTPKYNLTHRAPITGQTTTKNTMKNDKPTKPTNKETPSSPLVSQSIEESSNKDSSAPTIQIDLTTDEESLSSDPKSHDSSKISCTAMNEEFVGDDPSESKGGYLKPRKDSVSAQLKVLPTSLGLDNVEESTDLTTIEAISSAINVPRNVQPLFQSIDLAQQQARKRKQTLSSNEFSRKKCLTVDQSPEVDTIRAIECDVLCKSANSDNIKSIREVTNKLDANIGSNCKPKSDNIAGSISDSKTEANRKAILKANSMPVLAKDKLKSKRSAAGRNLLTEWNMMNQLVTIICRNELHYIEPTSPHQLKVKNEILIQMSINPDAIRSHTIIAQKMKGYKLEKFINECKIILSNVNRAGPATQTTFSELRDKLIKNMKSINSQRDITDESQNLHLVETKITNIIHPFLSPGNEDHSLIAKIIKNPNILENNKMIRSRITAKNQCYNDVLRDIKDVLDAVIVARSPKQFFLPHNRYVDVPFAVKLYQKSGRMTEQYAKELQVIIFDSINSLKANPKPKIRDVKFSDGLLMMICVNQKTFNWLERTISNHLGVEIIPFKNVISKSDLKTVCMKFKDPQYLHFNDLIEQLTTDNQRLLTRRWELRSPHFVDSTKCIYIGVDAESLVILEDMNCVGKLRGSSVFFVIRYDDNERNFERMDIVK